ncbi:hypothetical protein M408DRAFT_328008 [Serendipita vermifera MAFF 305830]|uniref:ADP-ribosylation factor n=1 Tax=Serendipita vermifera MAFF 305830 TaxID=933852 RepID=A0A0C2WW45_SERVB|nr:hypothetical protein M408DRAFT_328008 [Serendipita vermifera MAFF 305830]
MGNYISSMISSALNGLVGTKPVRIIMIGLDAAGKTTVLYKLKLGEVVTTIPTIGFNVESVKYKNIEFVLWDVGGQGRIRALWKHYFQNTQAIVYIVDAADTDRVDETRDMLNEVLSSDELTGAPLIVLANKQDLPGALTASELTQRLGLNTLRGRRWYIQACCATSGDGLYEGLDWLAKEVK